jgi:glucose/arabinose dehydrogenase
MRFALACWLCLWIGLAAAPEVRAAAEPRTFPTKSGPIRVITVAQPLEHPWGLAFLPDGRFLVSERPGRLRIIDPSGQISAPLAGVPAVFVRGQGGLLDVALDPRFADTGLVFFSYAEPGGEGLNGTALARGRLSGDRLEDVQVIFRQQPKLPGGLHFGSRIVFAPDGTLFLTLGERYQKERSQNLNEHLGKIVRINPDGSVPANNPFAGRADVRPEIYSLGHRNMQGATLHPETKRLWIVDHGARGGDEINLPEPGRNYGWPVITYGRDYSFLPIGEGTAKEGLEQPIHYWDPSIAPSGLAFYTGDRFPAWRGNLFVGSLSFNVLVRLDLDGTRVISEERLLDGLDQRIRDVRNDPDGFLYVLTDSDEGGLLRIEPAP